MPLEAYDENEYGGNLVDGCDGALREDANTVRLLIRIF